MGNFKRGGQAQNSILWVTLFFGWGVGGVGMILTEFHRHPGPLRRTLWRGPWWTPWGWCTVPRGSWWTWSSVEHHLQNKHTQTVTYWSNKTDTASLDKSSPRLNSKNCDHIPLCWFSVYSGLLKALNWFKNIFSTICLTYTCHYDILAESLRQFPELMSPQC